MEKLLSVRNLSIEFERYDTPLKKRKIQTLKGVNLEISRGEIIAVVGASGSGKSLLAHSVLGILPKNAYVKGDIYFKGRPLTPICQKEVRGIEISLIPQSVNYLDPILKIKKQLCINKFDDQCLNKVLQQLELNERVLELYPHQLSGGMARSILFGTALITEAELIIADEPTPGMHLTQAVNSLSALKKMVLKKNMSVLLITHDIDLAIEFADKITFFYDGKTTDSMTPTIFQKGPTNEWSPFTKKMWQALPQNGFMG